MSLSRRRFLGLAVRLAGFAVFAPSLRRLLASATVPDLVAVRNGEPEAMFDAAIAALGGMGRFVKPGQTVLVKPNIGWSLPPERAANTHPGLVGRIVEQCYRAGARQVLVFDHTCNYWEDCYRLSGIAAAVRSAGGRMLPGNDESFYRRVELPHAAHLRIVKVHGAFLDADVVINVPVLKHHGSARLTIGMKNLMGVVWDRGIWHAKDLHRCIADFAAFRRPDLTVVDAYRVMFRNGPRGVSTADVRLERMQIVSPDIVAADAAAGRVLGLDPGQVPYIVHASRMGLGRMDLERLDIRRITL